MKNWFKKIYSKLPNKLQRVLKSKRFLISFSIILLLVFLAMINSSKNKKPIEIIVVKKGTISQEVSLTGIVKPTQNIDYAFDRSGRISKIHVKTGDIVEVNSPLISLDNADAYAQYQQALASLRIQQIKLDNYRKGTRIEDLQIAQNQFDDTDQKLTTAYKNMYSSLFSNYNSIEKSVATDMNAIFNYLGAWNVQTPTYNSSFKTCHDVNFNSPLILRKNFDNSLNSWKHELTLISSLDRLAIYNESLKVKEYLDQAYDLIASINNIIDPNCNLQSGTDRTTIESHKTNALSIQTAIESTRNTFLQTKSSLDTLTLAYNTAKQNLEVKKNPYTNDDIMTQEAIVAQAQASADSASANYNKTILKAPFTGKITKIIPGIGDIISPNTTVISLIGDDTYQVEVNISEADIAKIKIGNTAKVTLDAYSSDIVFPASIVQVDLSASVIDGVANYRSIIKFDNKDSRIMPGMTANIDVLALKKDNVLLVPSRAIITKDGKKFVKVVKGKENILTNIITGIRGSEGNTEILSGISLGDQIVSQ